MDYAIIGMQYGSEAKGALAGYLALQREPDVVVCNFSPNAGHTFKNGDFKLVRKQLPIGTISPKCQIVLLGPGSIIDPQNLAEELETCNAQVIIHPNAGVVTQYHREMEVDLRKQIGSTAKGAGQAAIQRMQRLDGVAPTAIGALSQMKGVVISENAYHDALWGAKTVQIEGCQGYSLSMYHGFYPYTTSRDTTVHQLLADVGWHGNRPVETYGCVRSYPIRVAGNSGPHFADQRETSWEELGVEPEITTVTQKVRRVFTYSSEQVQRAQLINNCDEIYLSFCDYLEKDPDLFGMVVDDLTRTVGKPVKWLSFGPDVKDMEEIGERVQDREESTAAID